MNCPTEEHLLEFLDGQARTEDCGAIEAHLTRCGRCAESVANLRTLIGGVENESDTYQSEGRLDRIIDSVRAERAVAAERRDKARWLGMVWKGLAAMAAAGAVALILIVPPSEDASFGVREDGFHGASHVGLRVLQIRSDETQPSEVTRQLPQDADLLFMYTNRPERPFDWLSILARDANGRVHWLQPPRPTEPGASTAFPIRPTSATEMWTGIAQRIRLLPPTGALMIGAVFSRQPLPLGQMEGWMSAAATATAMELDPTDTVTQLISLTVHAPIASSRPKH